MASAKLANKTVNHSQSVICRLKANSDFERNSKSVVTTLHTSTTNITGLRIMARGLSFRTESHDARRMMLRSHKLLVCDLSFFAIRCPRTSFQLPSANAPEPAPGSG